MRNLATTHPRRPRARGDTGPAATAEPRPGPRRRRRRTSRPWRRPPTGPPARLAACLLACLLACPLSGCGGRERDRPVTVFAAASLTDALETALADLERREGIACRVSFGASSTLARQILAGAPADLYLSANRLWMDELERAGRLEAGTRRDLLGNELVLVLPRDAAAAPVLAPGRDLGAQLDGRLAVADPEHVPAGLYARQGLVSLGLWQGVRDRLAVAADVRGALAFVARGECPAGVVYATDAAVEDGVRVGAVFPVGSHDLIVYPGAVLAGAGPDARRVLDWLAGPAALAIFTRAGFRPAPTAEARP